MEIPKTIYKDNHEYKFIQKCNNKLFLYESDLGYKETFDLYDLGLINNRKIDKKINTRVWNNVIYVVYDRLLEEEKEYTNTKSIADELNVGVDTIRSRIRNHNWLDNRWFIERRHI